MLTTEFYDEYTTQTLSLNSYSNNVSFTLCGAQLTPENLRQLADELESVRYSIS